MIPPLFSTFFRTERTLPSASPAYFVKYTEAKYAMTPKIAIPQIA
jgi:hypothetical protein